MVQCCCWPLTFKRPSPPYLQILLPIGAWDDFGSWYRPMVDMLVMPLRPPTECSGWYDQTTPPLPASIPVHVKVSREKQLSQNILMWHFDHFISSYCCLYFLIFFIFKYLSHFVFEQLNPPPPPPPEYCVLLSYFHSQIWNTAPWPTNVRLSGPLNTCFPVGREGICMSLFWVPCLLILLHKKVCFHCLIWLFPALCLFTVGIISSPSVNSFIH